MSLDRKYRPPVSIHQQRIFGLFVFGIILLNFALSLNQNFIFHIALSKDSLYKLKIWQLFTSPLLFPLSQDGSNNLSFFFKLFLFFITAKQLIISWGYPTFLQYIGASALVGSLCAAQIMYFLPFQHYYGFEVSLHCSLLAAALMAKKHSLFVSDFSLRDLSIAFLVFDYFMAMLQGQVLSTLCSAIVLFFSYLYLQLALDLKSDFVFFKKLEEWLSVLVERQAIEKQRKIEIQEFMKDRGKIFDFRTGDVILLDEDFIDAMLTKVQLYGKSSLSTKEKRRLKSLHYKF